MTDAYIIDAVRTPRAKRKGKFTTVHPVDLATYPLNAIVQRNKIEPGQIEDVILGCVTQAGEQGWCVGRAAVLASGWPHTVPATTVNRLCGSGQQAANFAAMGIASGNYDLAIGGGLEHMTRVPMFSDIGGEESPLLKKHHPDLVQQGLAAELLSEKYKITRKEADEFALRSQKNAKRAQDESRFAKSLIGVPYKDDSGAEKVLEADDNLRPETTFEGLNGLKTVFKPDGIITAGNASAIVDGAAAVLLASEKRTKELNLTPRARMVAMGSVGSDPRIMLDGPVAAIELALRRAKLSKDDIDLWEINEAFAPVPLVVIKQLGLDIEKVNVNGGGIALGHPLGATGAMLLGTAIDELERTKGRRALITMCIGLGMGIATIIERV
ncbi:MAG: thiolase family protein [Deltaproteobacteria bacterium]|nr:thiolase family protein [Deltaproteobacteria bacterium]